MLNEVKLIGFVGVDPTLKSFDSGKNVANFTLATSEIFKKGESKETRTEWHNIVAWGNLATIARKIVKAGTLLFVAGRLRTRTWEDENGKKCYITEIYADRIINLDRKDKNQEDLEGSQEVNMPDDLPF